MPQLPQKNQQSSQQQQTVPNGQGMQFEDADILQVCLNESKHIATALNIFIQDASDEQLRRDYMTMLGDLYNQQKQIFDIMQQKGFYEVKTASPQDITQAQQKFSAQS